MKKNIIMLFAGALVVFAFTNCSGRDCPTAAIETQKTAYFKENKFSDFTEYLKQLLEKDKECSALINYYIALARSAQLKYLEENQSWDEYFSKGNDYKQELVSCAQEAINNTGSDDELNIHSRLLLWQFHAGQNDTSSEKSLEELMTAAQEYAKGSKGAKVIKEVADALSLSGRGEKARQLYKLYASGIINSDISAEDLRLIAEGFYKENNLDLAQTLYDAYIEKLAKSGQKSQTLSSLIELAKSFSYKDQGPCEPRYAEKIFGKIEKIGGVEAFDEDLMYLRAFNLEKAKEFMAAKDIYIQLIKRFPNTARLQKINYKVGLIYVYVGRDAATGKNYFEKVISGKGPDPYTLSALYQLGILSQWQGEPSQAQGYYDKLMELSRGLKNDLTDLARERLKEIESNRPLDYNNKMFLDLSLRGENASFDMSKFGLKAHPYISKTETNVNISTIPYMQEAGCMQAELQYLWAGDTGSKNPAALAASFKTSYSSTGTKIIGLTVISPNGIVDRDFDLLDVE